MRYRVHQLRSLAVTLKELEPHVRHGLSLQVGREDKKLKQRPRELLGNWLLAVVGCANRGKETLVISEDPMGGDGIITDVETDLHLFTEHVYITSQVTDDFGRLVADAVAHKMTKGAPYTKGRTLVIFSEAIVDGFDATALARQIAGTHTFRGVWLLAPDAPTIARGRYGYNVVELDATEGDAPVARVVLEEDFSSWVVGRIQ